MRANRFFGIAVLASIGIGTHFITSFAIGMVRKQEPGQELITEASFDKEPALGKVDQRTARVNNYPAARSSVRIQGAEPRDGLVEITAVGRLENQLEDRRFIWSLRLRRADESKLLLEQLYDNQIGLSPKGSNTQPTFGERLALPTGEYQVEIAIIELPIKGAESLADDEDRRSWTLAADVRDVIVP